MIKQSNRVRRTSLERVYRVRLENVRKLVQSYNGNKARLARALDVTPAFITHIAGEAPIKAIGEKLARDIEAKLGLYSGYLDAIH